MGTRALSCVLTFALAAIGSACSGSSEPTRSFNICVHAQDAPFVPGSTGDECTVTQQLRSGQTRTIDVEADKLAGDDRSATLAIEFAPNGWTVELGGTTVLVPGKQTLLIEVPASAVPGTYHIAIRGTSNGEQVLSVFKVTVVNPV
jgi:hypothetical protein